VNPSEGRFTLQEAIELEREAHVQDLKRQQDIIDKKRRQGIPIPGEVLSRKEQEARIWAFMSVHFIVNRLSEQGLNALNIQPMIVFRNYKPTDSDLEDDSDGESDDPSTWWDDEDEQDGVKGQQIVQPDEDLSDVIRIDTTRIPHNTLYEYET
jgi:hypothetical protein